MPAPRGPIDRSGDAMEEVDAIEAARLLGHPRPGSLPKALLACADSTEPDADGSADRLVWRRATLWRYADTALAYGATTIDGRPALDRTGIAKHLGVAVGTVHRWMRNSARNGFPAPPARGWYYTDHIDQWYRGRRTVWGASSRFRRIEARVESRRRIDVPCAAMTATSVQV